MKVSILIPFLALSTVPASAAKFNATANLKVAATFGESQLSVLAPQAAQDDPRTAEGITLDTYPIDLSNLCNETFFRGTGPFGDNLYIMPRVSMSTAQRTNVQLTKGAKDGTFDLSFALAIQSPKILTRAPWQQNLVDLIDDVAFQEDEPSNCDARQIGRQAAIAELRAKGYYVSSSSEFMSTASDIIYHARKDDGKPMYRRPYAVSKPAFNRIEVSVVGTSAVGILAPQAGAVNLDNPRAPVTVSLSASDAKMVRAQMAQNGILVEVRFVVSSRPAEYLRYSYDGQKVVQSLKGSLGGELPYVGAAKFQTNLANALSESNLTIEGRGDGPDFVRQRDALVTQLMGLVLSESGPSGSGAGTGGNPKVTNDVPKLPPLGPAPVNPGPLAPLNPSNGNNSNNNNSNNNSGSKNDRDDKSPNVSLEIAYSRLAMQANGSFSFLGTAKAFAWPAYVLVKKGEYTRDLYLAPTGERVEQLSSLSKGDQVFLSVKTGTLETILKARDRIQQEQEEADIAEWHRVNGLGLKPTFTPPLVICADQARNLNWDDDPREMPYQDEWLHKFCGDQNPGVPLIVQSSSIDDGAMARDQRPGDASLAAKDDFEYLRSVRSLLQNQVVRLAYRNPEAPMTVLSTPYEQSFGKEMFENVFMKQDNRAVRGIPSSFLGFKFPVFGGIESTYSGVLGNKSSGPASGAVYYTRETLGTNYYTFGFQISTLMWRSTAELSANGITNPSIPIASILKKTIDGSRRQLLARQVKLMVGLSGTDEMISFADLLDGKATEDFTSEYDAKTGGVKLTMLRDGAAIYLYNYFTPRGNLHVRFPRLAATQSLWNYDWNYNSWNPLNRWIRNWFDPKEDGDRLVEKRLVPIGLKPIELPVERMNYLVNLRLMEPKNKPNNPVQGDLLALPVSALDKVIETSKAPQPDAPIVTTQPLQQAPIKP